MSAHVSLSLALRQETISHIQLFGQLGLMLILYYN